MTAWDGLFDIAIPDLAGDEWSGLVEDPCPECGEFGACAYDQEGRALIHAPGDDEEDR